MLRTFALTILIALAGCATGGAEASDASSSEQAVVTEKLSTFNFAHDGAERTYTVYRPDTYESQGAAVLLLHGGNQSAKAALAPRNPTRHWIEIADREDVLLIVPNGYNNQSRSGLGLRQSWNDLRDDRSGRTSRADDVAFLSEVLNRVARDHDFDRQHLFVTGASNGGMMAMRLLIERPQDFAGAASFIAALPEETVPEPNTPTPILLVNGTKDRLLPFDGGSVSGAGAPIRSVPETVQYWLEAHGLSETHGVVETLPDGPHEDNCTFIRTRYAHEDNQPAQIEFIEIRGGGHNVPDPNPMAFRNERMNRFVAPRCRDAHGVELAWEFFDALIDR